MPHRIAERQSEGVLPCAPQRAALALCGLFVSAVLAACSSTGDTLTVFADPGKYQYYTCEQMAGQRKYWTNREQELRQLMDKAEQGTGGAVVNVLAYKADHVAASEELRVIENTARAKNCNTPETWKSNSSVK